MRLIAELEALLADAPRDDTDVASLLKDIERCKDITKWIGNKPIGTPGT